VALYKYSTYLKTSTSDVFDKTHSPGQNTPHSGIYRCTVCGWEVVSETNNPFPPQNHHQHSGGQPVTWKLNVYSEGKPPQ
jgi:hypothetical protein